MNIDIVNKAVAKKLNVQEKSVALINQFYWQQVKKHLYDYNPRPINIDNVCVIHPDKKEVKEKLKYYITRIKRLKATKKFNHESPKYKDYMEQYKNYFRKFWSLRKGNKFTN